MLFLTYPIDNWGDGQHLHRVMVAPLKLVDPNETERLDLAALNSELADASAEELLEWSRNTFGDDLVLTSSFGADSAVRALYASFAESSAVKTATAS